MFGSAKATPAVVTSYLKPISLDLSFRALEQHMLRQFSEENQAGGNLDLEEGCGGSLDVVLQTACFRGDPFEHIVNEALHDEHRPRGEFVFG